MPTYAIPPPPVPAVAIADSTQQFPVRRIHCVGRNYAEHTREMGKDPTREAPFFFQKPADAIVPHGANVPYPPLTHNFHHEIEFVVAIGREGVNVETARALEHVFGYAVGNDFTRRDLQFEARDKGRPWEPGKAFDHSAAITALHTVERVGHIASGRIWLSVNGAVRQQADVRDLIWSVPEIIAILSTYVRLMPGDLIYTGTPAGVGALQRGDIVEGGVEGLDTLMNRIA
jgi:fumarylpyruvate hydrolase